jgi:hypothetical protein
MKKLAEVETGFEPAYNGFANRCLTAWLPHRRDETIPTVLCFRQDETSVRNGPYTLQAVALPANIVAPREFFVAK